MVVHHLTEKINFQVSTVHVPLFSRKIIEAQKL